MNIQKMMKQAQQMQQKMAEMQQEMETKTAEGQAGAGMVKITVNGKGHMQAITIAPDLLAPDEKEVLEDLIIAAHRDAKEKMDAEASDAMGELTGGMSLPPGFKMPF
jgi:DNA-binding YbaB/EbfC family protein